MFRVAGHRAELIATEDVVNVDKPLLAARSQAPDDLDIVSFDRGLDRVPGLRRHEPV